MIFKTIKYTFCLAKITDKFHELTEDEKCSYMIANYMFYIVGFFLLSAFFYIGLDDESYGFVCNKIKNPAILSQMIIVFVSGVLKLGHFSLRRVNWNRAPRWEVVSDKISMFFQAVAIILTLYCLSGIFLF